MAEYLPEFKSVDETFWFWWLAVFSRVWGAPTIWRADKESENETSEWELVTHNPEQVKAKRNALYAVVRD